MARPVSRSGSGSSSKRFKIVLNSPVILSFTLLCAVVLFLSWLTGGKTDNLFFSVYRSSLANPLTYVRFFGHVLGHADIFHLVNNLMLILVIGPLLEERYGAKWIILMMVTTAVITGLLHFILFPGTALLGASGIVFAFIMLSSITGFKDREIPLTFILVAVLYLGQQIYQGLQPDSVSQLTHIAGGVIGTLFGLRLNRR